MSFLHPALLFALALVPAPWLWRAWRRRAGKTTRVPTLFFLDRMKGGPSRRAPPAWLETLLESLILLFAVLAAAGPRATPLEGPWTELVIFLDNGPSMVRGRGPRTSRALAVETAVRLADRAHLAGPGVPELRLADWEDVAEDRPPRAVRDAEDLRAFANRQTETASEARAEDLLRWLRRRADTAATPSRRVLLLSDRRFLRGGASPRWPPGVMALRMDAEETLDWVEASSDTPLCRFEGDRVTWKVRILREGSAGPTDLRVTGSDGRLLHGETLDLTPGRVRASVLSLPLEKPGLLTVRLHLSSWEGAGADLFGGWRALPPTPVAFDGGAEEIASARRLLAEDLRRGHWIPRDDAPLRVVLDPSRGKPGANLLVFLPGRLAPAAAESHLARLALGRFRLTAGGGGPVTWKADAWPDPLRSLRDLGGSPWRPTAGLGVAEGPADARPLLRDDEGRPVLYACGPHLLVCLDPESGGATLRHETAVAFLSETLAFLAGGGAGKTTATGPPVFGEGNRGVFADGDGLRPPVVRGPDLRRWMTPGGETDASRGLTTVSASALETRLLRPTVSDASRLLAILAFAAAVSLLVLRRSGPATGAMATREGSA